MNSSQSVGDTRLCGKSTAGRSVPSRQLEPPQRGRISFSARPTYPARQPTATTGRTDTIVWLRPPSSRRDLRALERARSPHNMTMSPARPPARKTNPLALLVRSTYRELRSEPSRLQCVTFTPSFFPPSHGKEFYASVALYCYVHILSSGFLSLGIQDRITPGCSGFRARRSISFITLESHDTTPTSTRLPHHYHSLPALTHSLLTFLALSIIHPPRWKIGFFIPFTRRLTFSFSFPVA